MSLRINLNSMALTAHRNLSGTDSALGKSIERLSSGYKINSAADDPAGLVISEKLRAQVSGLQQAIRNASDAVNMVRTAEGALNEVSSLLRSMRDLAVHAANTGATDAASAAADQAQIIAAIQALNKIAEETQFGQKKLLNGSAGITATATGSAATAANFSAAALTSDTTVSVNVTQAATKATITGTAEIDGDLTGSTITINGVEITGGANAAATIQAINNATDQTGVIASNDGSDHLVLTQVGYGSGSRIDVTGGTDLLGVDNAAAVGIDAEAIVTKSDGSDVSDALWTSGKGLVLKDSLGNTISLTAAAGEVADDKGAQFNVQVGSLTFQVGSFANQTRTLSIQSISAANLGTTTVTGESLATVDVTTSAGAQNAILILDEAITDISSLRASLGATQKNVLESSISSLSIAKENIAASESTIRDADMAAEMVDFTKNQILQQAGVSMLAQANQAPQALLALLK